MAAKAGKQAKLISTEGVSRLLRLVARHRYAERDCAIVPLSLKAGLRACEIADLTWSMLLDLDGRVADVIELHDAIAKKGGGRTIPIHPRGARLGRCPESMLTPTISIAMH